MLGAVKLYCGDHYGGMLARLDSPEATKLMNCWGTAIKQVYARWLGSGHTTIREDLLSRWPKFFRSLLNGPTPEVAMLTRVTTTAGQQRPDSVCNQPEHLDRNRRSGAGGPS